MAKLEIGDKVKNKVELPKDEYRFVLVAMHGDADKYENVDVYVKGKNNQYLEQFLNDLLEFEGSSFGYNQNSTLDKWLDDISENPAYNEETWDWENEPEDMIIMEWPHDVTCQDMMCTLTGITVSYFDENSVLYEVNILK